MTEYGDVDLVVGKALHILGHAEFFEPIRNLLHRRPPTDLTLSVLDRHVGEFTNTRKDGVAPLSRGALLLSIDTAPAIPTAV